MCRSEELFYQLALRQFGDMARLRLDPPPLVRTLVALAVDLPQLDLYSRVAEDLARSNAKYKENFEEMEREAALDTPELFQEYMLAEPEDQEGFRVSVKLLISKA